jgi:hypothetical protein
MRTRIAKFTQAAVGAALIVGAFALPASAEVRHRGFHHRIIHHHSVGHDIMVSARPKGEPVVATHDAFHGPAAIITAPVAIVGTVVSLPFRAVEAIFPPRAADPRVVVGAPVHLASQIAEFPFFVVNGAFGAPPTL